MDDVASLRAEIEQLRSKVNSTQSFNDNLQGDGKIRVGGNKLSVNGLTNGPTGSTGVAGATGASPTGIQGPTGPTGPIGPSGVNPGKNGPLGPTGPTGPTSAKSSIVQTRLGNVAFACFENARPKLFHVYRGVGPCEIELHERLTTSVVPGSLHAMSLTHNKAALMGAKIEGSKLIVSGPAGMKFIAVVAGTHKDFPDWDMPLVSDEAAQRSRKFWSGEHTL